MASLEDDPYESVSPPRKKLKEEEIKGEIITDKEEVITDKEEVITDKEEIITDSESDTEDEEIARERRIFESQFESSHGFDINFDEFKHTFRVLPLPLEGRTIATADEGTNRNVVMKCLLTALNRYNQKKGTRLEFVKIEKVNHAVGGGHALWITFHARDLNSSDEESKIYQTRLRYCCQTVYVYTLRPKPTEPNELPIEPTEEEMEGADLEPYLFEIECP